jgi:hypothetical protein
MLNRNSELGRNMARLAAKLGGLEEESNKKRFALFGS